MENIGSENLIDSPIHAMLVDADAWAALEQPTSSKLYLETGKEREKAL
jgi:hypothetical protein